MNELEPPLPTTSLVDVLRKRSASDSLLHDHPAFTFHGDGNAPVQTLTFAQLDFAARSVAANLREHAQAGERVLLAYAPGLDYIKAFFGCMYAGLIAVPALPPSSRRTLPRLELIIDDACPAVILAAPNMLEQFAPADGGPARLSLEAMPERAGHWCPAPLSGASICFLQYTSGSTAEPKGVIVTHENIIANLDLGKRVYGLREGDCMVSWLPPHHDFGLIGAILLPVFVGAHSVQMSPASFLMRPIRWLELLSHYRARMSGAPNFAYELCVARISEEQKAKLDLSALDILVSGAERVRSETLLRFAHAFVHCGLRPEALTPAYGLAESTLLVSANVRHAAGALARTVCLRRDQLEAHGVEAAADRQAIELVSCGAVNQGEHQVRIVEPHTMLPISTGVGEIWVSGKSVAPGYWNRGTAEQPAFGARLPNDDALYLRTGDLGFIQDGELYVTGRIKEMMIFQGRNVYPQDLERDVEKLDPAFRNSGCAAFSVEAGGASVLVIVQELNTRARADTGQLPGLLAAMLAEDHELINLHALVLVKAGAVPRTSSGKIQRLRARAMFEANEFAPVFEWRGPSIAASRQEAGAALASPTERKLASIWEAILGRRVDTRDANFFTLGAHSLSATELVHRVRMECNAELPLSAVFDAPVLTEQARRIDVLLASAQALSPQVLDRAHGSDGCSLSPSQHRFWFADQMGLNGPAFQLTAAVRLDGDLNEKALIRALDELIAEHDVLRMRVAMADGAPIQLRCDTTKFPLRRQDLRALAPDERDAQVLALCAEEAGTGFELAKGPLLRALLLRCSERSHVFQLTAHHIIADGYSAGLIMEELALRYAGARPAAPAVQYANYVSWLERSHSAPRMAQQLSYWRAQLDGAPTLLELPTDRPRPAVQSLRGEALHVTLAPTVAEAVRRISRDGALTPYMVLLAAWSLLMARLSGQREVVVGCPIAGRDHPLAETMLGVFVNSLALRLCPHWDGAVDEYLDHVRATALAAYSHAAIPFERVVQATQPARSLRYSPVFQTWITFDSWAGLGDICLPGLHATALPVTTGATQFDLAFLLKERDGAITAVLEYASDLFEASTVERMVQQFETILLDLARDIRAPLHQVSVLPPAQRRALLIDCNATSAPLERRALVHELFEARAAAAPDAPAVLDDGRTLSYGQLNAQANRLAHQLLALGVTREDRVAICAERSIAAIVGVLAILKAGAAYVPLDPALPDKRLAYMLGDCAPAVLLIGPGLGQRLPAMSAQTLELDATEQWSQYSDANPVKRAPGELGTVAYVIYTSGSTGQPKGVMVEHHALINLLQHMQREPGIATHDTLLFIATFSFDIAGVEMFLPLVSGARIVVADRQAATDPARIAQLLEAHDVTLLQATPATWRLLVNAGWEGKARLTAISGGEALAPELAAALGARVGALWNLYGPTETTIYCTGSRHLRHDPVTLGRPMANTQIYILDRYRQPVPVGVIGEIYIGGAGLARGYLNRPELTAERFLANPFAPESLLYRSGDLGRWRADGRIDYQGREDFQIKIRGYRIEPAEIEMRLACCSGVQAAVVLAREDTPGDVRLVAYVVSVEGAALEPAVLRAALAADMAEYMVPSAFVQLSAFPLTPNGKLDRQALPAPQLSALSARQFESPIGPTEQAVAAAWQDLLGVERAGRHDHFFELGGHSLLAAQLVVRLRDSLGVDIALRELFAQPVLADFSQAVARALPAAVFSLALADRALPLPLSPAQRSLWLLSQLNADASAAYHMPAGLRLKGRLDRDALQQSLDKMVARHEVLRTTFAGAGHTPMQHIGAPDSGFALTFLDLRAHPLALQDELVQRTGAAEAAQPFDLAVGPLIRGKLLQLRDDLHVMFVTQHHIISDGWSIGILTAELMALYDAFRQKLPDPLTPLPCQYADYVAWQRQHLCAERVDAHLAFWRGHLGGAPALLELPTDRPRSPLQTHAGASIKLRLDAANTASLRRLSQRHGATLFMALLSSWALLMARVSGQDDIVVCTPTANRQHAQFEGLIGFFVNTLALRVRLDGQPTVAQLLAQVRQTTLQAHEHQELPFEQVIEALRAQRQPGHAPMFQTSLILDNTARHVLQLPELRIDTMETPIAGAKYDLSLFARDDDHGLDCELVYNTGLFDSATVQALLSHWTDILRSIVHNDDAPIAQLTVGGLAPAHAAASPGHPVTPGRGFIAFQTNEIEQSIGARFAAQAQQRWDHPAVIGPGQTLSYGQLYRRALQLASTIAQAPAASPVGLLLSHGQDMIVGILGSLLAGRCYVPLDPEYPQARLAFMLDDSAASTLIASPAHRVLGDQLAGRRIACFDLDQLAALPDAGAALLPAALGTVAPETPAYILYTSGSSGQPKGVVQNHRNALYFCASYTNNLLISSADRVALLASFSFDAAVMDLFGALLNGAAVVAIDPRELAAEPLLAFLERQHVSIYHSTPTLYRHLFGRQVQARLSGARLVVLGGEPVTRGDLDIFLRVFQDDCVFVNGYGPTESTLALQRFFTKQSALPSKPITAGNPIAGTTISLGQPGTPLMPLQTGEIIIQSPYVALGYHQRPDLNASAFGVCATGQRYYRTGDIGRVLADGTLHVLGRADHQVKLRGFRIELGEIEAQLAACPGVREAIVLVREDSPGDQRLVAYVLTDGAWEQRRVAALLAASVPSYMLPSAYVEMERFPTSPNRKIDRRALPAPHQDQCVQATAPATPTERRVAAIWQSVLGRDAMGVDDNFIASGGHSLLAMQALALVNQAFKLNLPLACAMRLQTIGTLATEIDALLAQRVVDTMRADTLPLRTILRV